MATEQERQLFASKVLVAVGRVAVKLPESKVTGFMAMVGCLYAVLVQTARGIGDNEIWRIAKRNGILYLPGVGSKTTSFFSAFAGISASN